MSRSPTSTLLNGLDIDDTLFILFVLLFKQFFDILFCARTSYTGIINTPDLHRFDRKLK